MSVIISGKSYRAFYSPNAFPSRLSVHFAATFKAGRTPSTATPLSVTVSIPKGCFTTVLNFMTDPLCKEDVVLGKDWTDSCHSIGLSPPLDSFPLYQAGASILPCQNLIC